ncbi:YjfB family protein [Paenibacillus timonensis]|uniref:YjfB family protein n=1 Tax=Paenibacillus timonensis TaxID=225915 RepID=A0ABW3S8X4_9BACL|nr:MULTISPECIES: YjfB family protein [Paenibacillus]MCH1638671.1 YjfB family protein [Paenibacillus timonensis]MDU2239690.1 YjfB family protein [Paenibacillus sp.]
MDIAATSVAMSQSALSQAVGIRVLSMAKNQAEIQGQNLVQMLSQSQVHPTLGKNLDIKV